MHEKVLPKHSLDLLSEMEAHSSPLLANWILAGGTGLAFLLGHRISEDLDFFRTDNLDLRDLHPVLARHGPYETLQESERTLTVLLQGTKLSFFRVRDPFIFEPQPYRFFSVASVEEIALMKLVAISSRGSRKDFADLYVILQQGGTLEAYFDMLPRKYGASRVNTYHILKSLTYFADAEKEPMPRMLVPFDWDKCKAFFVRQARTILLP